MSNVPLGLRDQLLDLLLEELHGWAALTLSADGCVATWNTGAERMWRYRKEEIMGQHMSQFFAPLDVALGRVDEAFGQAAAKGRSDYKGVSLRRNGDRFGSLVVFKRLGDDADQPEGFAMVTHDVSEQERVGQEIEKLNAELEQRVAARTAELERMNEELRAFSYSVSHDLRAPLLAIDGFSQALVEDYSNRLDAVGLDFLQRVRSEAQRMGELMDDLLGLFRVARTPLRRSRINLSEMAQQVGQELARQQSHRSVQFVVRDGMVAEGDERLLRVVLENLLENAWKFTRPRRQPRVEFDMETSSHGQPVWRVRDNGVGFDMAYADRLFSAFQRLHAEDEFAGTGIGLATVQRIIHRHGGRIWVDAEAEKGAEFYFTLNESPQ